MGDSRKDLHRDMVNLNTESETLSKIEVLVVFRKLAKHLPYILVQEVAEEPSRAGCRNI
jgi:hypothetical protein